MANPRIIGLLGGSFNPAHAGHVHLSREAIKALGLSQVWWLVSPQNPLKTPDDMAGFEQRLHEARRVAAPYPHIHVSDFEQRAGTRYTADTLEALLASHRDLRFVWLMGADNLAQIDRWQNWQHIFSMVPVAVYDRKPHTFKALRGKAAQTYAKQRVPPRLLPSSPLPAWSFIHGKRHPLSATFIRNLLGHTTFMGHNK
jgi:nicotinate-nucleotide adenylyltransferase